MVFVFLQNSDVMQDLSPKQHHPSHYPQLNTCQQLDNGQPLHWHAVPLAPAEPPAQTITTYVYNGTHSSISSYVELMQCYRSYKLIRPTSVQPKLLLTTKMDMKRSISPEWAAPFCLHQLHRYI